jgi:hypothetical protein
MPTVSGKPAAHEENLRKSSGTIVFTDGNSMSRISPLRTSTMIPGTAGRMQSSPRRKHHFAEISTINASTERTTHERSLMAEILNIKNNTNCESIASPIYEQSII